MTAQSDPASALIRRVNEYRVTNGASPLEVNSALMNAAQRHATWQAVNRVHSHQGEGGTMPQDRAAAAGYQGLVAENVASGTRGYVTPAWAVEGWAGSYGHRVTMLSNNIHIGVGVAENDEETFYVLMVGNPSANVPVHEIPGETPQPEQPQVAVVAPIVLATPREDGSIVHVVQSGQTAWAIAASYSVSLDELLATNHLSGNAVLHPGDEVFIRLGEGQQLPPAPTLPATHIVQTGETLWRIAAEYGMTLDDLLTLNGLARGAIIKPGDEIRLRAPEPTPTLEPVTAAPTIPAPTPSYTHTPTVTVTPPPVTLTPFYPSTMTLPPTAPLPVANSSSKDTDLVEFGIVVVGLLFGIGVMVALRRSAH